MIKAAIEKIQEMSKPLLHTIGCDQFMLNTDGTYAQIRPELDAVSALPLHSLDALVQMVKTEALSTAYTPIYIEASGHDKVSCFLQPCAGLRNARPTLYTVTAKDVPGWGADEQLSFESALIAIRTRFQNNKDAEYLLRLLSEISNGAKVTYSDNGLATTVVSQKGIAVQGGEPIRPIVTLKPYRTFQEIDQPEGLFHIRIVGKNDCTGIRFIEADGGMWKLTARRTIVDYLTERLKDAVEDGKVVIML